VTQTSFLDFAVGHDLSPQHLLVPARTVWSGDLRQPPEPPAGFTRITDRLWVCDDERATLELIGGRVVLTGYRGARPYAEAVKGLWRQADADIGPYRNVLENADAVCGSCGSANVGVAAIADRSGKAVQVLGDCAAQIEPGPYGWCFECGGFVELLTRAAWEEREIDREEDDLSFERDPLTGVWR
jgi:hypothetical protein